MSPETATYRVMGRGQAGSLRTVGKVGEWDVSAIVRHGRTTPTGPFPGCETLGIQRASDGAWAWAFVDGATAEVRHVSTWSVRVVSGSGWKAVAS